MLQGQHMRTSDDLLDDLLKSDDAGALSEARYRDLRSLRDFHKSLMRLDIQEFMLSLELNPLVTRLEDIVAAVKGLDSVDEATCEAAFADGFREIWARCVVDVCWAAIEIRLL